MRRGLAPRHRLGHPGLDFGARPLALAVGRPLHDDRKRRLDRPPVDCRTIDVGREANSVAHGNHDIPMHDDIIG